MTRTLIASAAAVLLLALAACTPSEPADRAVGGTAAGTATGILSTPTPPPPPPRR